MLGASGTFEAGSLTRKNTHDVLVERPFQVATLLGTHNVTTSRPE